MLPSEVIQSCLESSSSRSPRSLLLSVPLASAQTKTFGAWTVVPSNDKEDLIAATAVDDDKYLAYRCFSASGKCAHIVNLAAECEDGKEYPVLINSSHAAAAITCTCSENDGQYELIPDFDDFHELLTKSSGYIGFALPMVSGQFKVVRFSLSGAKDAMRTAQRATTRRNSSEYH